MRAVLLQGRVAARQLTPENLDVEFLTVAYVPRNVHIGPGEVGRGVEKIEQILVVRNEPWLVGEECLRLLARWFFIDFILDLRQCL